MAKIISFQGIRYNPNKIESWSTILVPPYDVISAGERKQFESNHPYNMIHLTLAGPQGDVNPYEHVKQRLNTWLKDAILVQDKESCIYYYSMEYQIAPDFVVGMNMGNTKRTLSGFIGLVKLEDFENGVIIPHEITFPKPQEDRLKLLESCHAHFEPIYALYEDKSRKINYAFQKSVGLNKPNIEITDSNETTHRFWKVNHPQLIHQVESELNGKSLLIADGHHRYEAALAYRAKLRKKLKAFSNDHPANYMMMYLVNMDDPDLFISPTHRLIRNIPNLSVPKLHKLLEQHFALAPLKGESELLTRMADKNLSLGTFGFYDGKYYVLGLKQPPKDTTRLLDTDIFQDIVIDKTLAIPKQESMHDHIGFTHSLKETVQKVNSGEYQFAFILRPPEVHDVKRICEQGRRLPQKSTYFYPKPLSGLVLYVFDET